VGVLSKMDRRIQAVAVILALCFVVLIAQLTDIQFRQGPSLVNSKYNIAKQVNVARLARGSIISADDTVLAYSVATKDTYRYQRIYPLGPLFAGITGYFSVYYGASGLEAYYNSSLQSHEPTGSLRNLLSTPYETDDVVITVPAGLQAQVAQDVESRLGPSRTAAVVALDPRTGAILAMWAQPSYDPNPLASHDLKQEQAYWKSLLPSSPTTPLVNGAFGQTYAPGSTFKVVTTAAAFDHPPYPGFATSFSAPYTSSISLPYSNKGLHNFAFESCGGHIPELLRVSCDTGYGLMGLALGYKNLAPEAESFGFNSVPPLDETGVAESRFPKGCGILPFIAYCAIGQYSVTASALQMALVAAGIANDGVIMKPHLMAYVTDAFGRTVLKYKPVPWKFATSAATARQVRQDMVIVAQRGTAAGLFPPGLVVGAKTGTAQTSPGAGNNNWLICFGPAGPGQVPSVAVAVVVPSQAGLGADTTGAQIAGPIAAKVLEDTLNWESSHPE
jgi:peptidoglycan glycosyltransferase